MKNRYRLYRRMGGVFESKTGSTKDRWRRAAKETALDLIRDRVIIDTQAEQLLACLKAGTVSTNRLQCFGHRAMICSL